MSGDLVFFYLYAALALVGAVALVVARNAIHAVLGLFVTLIAIAGVYLLLDIQFLAAMQLFIYGGAVTVLVLFVVMLTRAAPEERGRLRDQLRPLPAVVCAVFFVAMTRVLASTRWTFAAPKVHDTASLASILFSRYVLPFELAGLALTVALVGAIVLAKDENAEAEAPAPLLDGRRTPRQTAEEALRPTAAEALQAEGQGGRPA